MTNKQKKKYKTICNTGHRAFTQFYSTQPPLIPPLAPANTTADSLRICTFISTRGFYFLMVLDFLTILSVTIPVSVGAVLASKIILNRPKSVDKYARKLDSSREKYIEELEDELKDAKNTMNSRERGPKVEGEMGNLENLLPELVGQFDSFAPKWLKPFLRNKEIQNVIITKVKDDPEKFAGYFSKLIGKKKPELTDNKTADSL